MKKNKREHKRERRGYKQKRELRRFDLVLKEIFSEQ